MSEDGGLFCLVLVRFGWFWCVFVGQRDDSVQEVEGKEGRKTTTAGTGMVVREGGMVLKGTRMVLKRNGFVLKRKDMILK